MVNEKSRVTQGQLMFLVLQSQIGVGVLSLPFAVQSVAKGGGLISTLLAGLIVQVVIVVLWALCRRFPSFTLYAFLPKITGRLLGTVLNLAYIAFFLLVGGLVLVIFCDVISRWILTETPRWAVMALMVGTGVYMVRESLRAMARFYVSVSFLIVLLFLTFVYAYTVNIDWTYIFPVTEAGWLNIVKGSNKAMLAMLGYEILLVAYPFVEGKADGKLKAASAAHLFVTLFYTFVVFTSLIIFSPAEITLVPEPLPYMLKAFVLEVVERLDLLFLTIWVVNVATSFMTYLFLASNGLGRLFHRGEHRKAVPYAALICFVIAMIPQAQADVMALDQLVTKLSYAMIGGLPLLLLLLSYLLKRKDTEG